MKKIIDMLIPQKSPYKKWTFFILFLEKK